MSSQVKKSLAFFLVVLCGVGFLNCKSNRKPQADQDSISRAEQREADFMQKRAEYIKENGHDKHYNMQNGRVYEWVWFCWTHQDFFQKSWCVQQNQTQTF